MNKFLSALILSSLFLSADSIKIGSALSALDNFKYETPTGRQMKIPQKTKLVIVAFEKDTGALVNEYLNTQSEFYLLKNNSIFIADIHKMPSIVTSMFALPKLQKYKHLIYLHYDDKFQNMISNKDGKITLLRIEDSKIKEITLISSQQELKAAIEK